MPRSEASISDLFRHSHGESDKKSRKKYRLEKMAMENEKRNNRDCVESHDR